MSKVLVIHPFAAWPLVSGGVVRSYFTLLSLSSKHQVTLLQFGHSSSKFKNIEIIEFKPRSKSFFSFFKFGLPYWFSDWYNPDLIKWLHEHALEFDTIIIEFSQLLHLVKYLPSSVDTIFISHDVSTVSFWRRLKQEKNPFKIGLHLLRLIEVFIYEKRYLHQFNQVVAVSDNDAQILEKHFRLKDVQIIPNGLEKIHQLKKNPCQKIRVGFIGGMAHSPNLQSLNFILNKLLPSLNQSYQLILAGDSLDWFRSWQKKHPRLAKRVEHLGIVDDVSDFYKQVDLLAAPVFSGSGTRVKILESLSYLTPVITTTIGVEGIDIQHPYLYVLDRNQAYNVNAWQQALKNNFPLSEAKALVPILNELTWGKVLSVLTDQMVN